MPGKIAPRTRAIAYVRVSTAEQAEHGSSLAAQESKLRAYCDAMDLELVRVEVDGGISAATLRRPALQRALASLKSGEADAIVITKLDRITRNVVDLATLVDDYFRDERRALISLAESIDTKSAGGRLVLGLLVQVAQWEREACGERVAAVKAHQATLGRFLGGAAPYGYEIGTDGELVAVEAEQAVIAEARALRSAGMSLRDVAATLDERGIRARNGRRFAAAQIARMEDRKTEAA